MIANPKRLRSSVLTTAEIDEELIRELFRVFEKVYDEVNLDLFSKDLQTKQYVVLLQDQTTHAIKGFSTQGVYDFDFRGEAIRVLFSGDTVVDPEYWGEQELVKGWCDIAARVLVTAPKKKKVYWLLISKGYRTYLYLPVFFCEFYPCYHQPVPEYHKSLLECLAKSKFGSDFNSNTGLVQFNHSLGQLKPYYSRISSTRIDDPHVNFFLKRNPTFASGTELVCLTEVSLDNTRSIGQRLLRKAVHRHQSQPIVLA
jgi:hypothetical protein